jgi:hypothetical protein
MAIFVFDLRNGGQLSRVFETLQRMRSKVSLGDHLDEKLLRPVGA